MSMGFPRDDAKRVSQGQYWALFGAYMLAALILLVGGSVELARASLGLGLLMIAAIVPLGIYWRVVMMRRCRDIGWPAFLPWLLFGLEFAASFSITMSQLGARRGAAPDLSLAVLPLLLGLADFAFSIVIGCIGSKHQMDYETVFGDGPGYVQRPRVFADVPTGADVQTGAGDPDQFDEVIARALEAHRRGESLLGGVPRPAPAATSSPSPAARAPGSFGRRVI